MNLQYSALDSDQLPDGFILEDNRYDCLPLDDFFSGMQISGNSMKSLKKAGYFGYLAFKDAAPI